MFKVKIHAVFKVHSCPAKLAEEARGMWYWHQFVTCPDCQVEPGGFEVWGSNGHKQNEGMDAHFLHTYEVSRRSVVSYGEPVYYRAN